MGVYIKGMEMPKNCLSCPLQGGTADCRLTQKTYNWGLEERPSDCPLIPVPPHGRLIDASAIWNLLYDYADSIGMPDMMRFDKIMEAAFSNAPTIIEAEEGE